MDEKLREKVEKILDDENMGFAYLYPNDGMPRQEYYQYGQWEYEQELAKLTMG